MTSPRSTRTRRTVGAGLALAATRPVLGACGTTTGPGRAQTQGNAYGTRRRRCDQGCAPAPVADWSAVRVGKDAARSGKGVPA